MRSTKTDMDILGYYSRRAIDKHRVGYKAERQRAEEAMQFISDEDDVYFVTVSKNVVRHAAGGFGPAYVKFTTSQNGQVSLELTHAGYATLP